MTQLEAPPRVAIIGTGGTISTVGRGKLDLVEAGDFGQVVDAATICDWVPELREVATVVPVPFLALPSPDVGVREWLAMVVLIHNLARDDPSLAGIVITHGTATLEETAYFLHLTLKVSIPVIVVGSQRPLSALSSDAHLNLVNAVRLACAHEARGLGVLVVLNGEILSARDATKTSTYAQQSFQSPNAGPIGYVNPDGSISVYSRPTRRHQPDRVFNVEGLASLPRVDICYSYAGADDTAINAAVAAGARAIVSVGLPPGVTTNTELRALEHAGERGVVIIQSSRASHGPVLRSSRLTRAGIIAADNLSPSKARILAMLAIATGATTEEIQQCFCEF